MSGVDSYIPARTVYPVGIFLLFLLGACAERDAADDTELISADTAAVADTLGTTDPIARGERSYMNYCASCHGRDGTGSGPVADVLTTQPADLTQLRSQNGGVYPVDSVYAYIDGREDVQAHGTREMPVWGNVWGEVGDVAVPREVVDQRIRELVEYIRTLQAGNGGEQDEVEQGDLGENAVEDTVFEDAVAEDTAVEDAAVLDNAHEEDAA